MLRCLFVCNALLASSTALAAPTIDVDGWCPDVTIMLTDATPMRQVMLFTGDPTGTTTLARGPCAGTTLDLGDADERRNLLLTARTDSSGSLTFTPASVGRDGCTESVQGLDVSTCEVSPVVPLTIDCSATNFADELVAYWPGDGSALDVVGRHDGTIEGTVEYEPGVFGDAFLFDGWSAVKVRPYRDLEFDDGEPFTYAMWVDHEGGALEHLFGKRHLCGPGDSFDYQLVVEYGYTDLTSHSCNVVAPTVLPAGWRHVVASYDGIAFNLYIDGEVAGAGEPCDPDTIPTLGGELRIGSSGTCGTWYGQGWEGLVDEVMLWSRTLTDDEIVCAGGAGLYLE